MKNLAAVAASALILCSCSLVWDPDGYVGDPPGVAVSVLVYSDYLPGTEFGSVDVYLDDELEESLPARTSDDFIAGRMVAELMASEGTHDVRVELVGADGEPIGMGEQTLMVAEPETLTFIIGRRCDPECPSCDSEECSASVVCATTACVEDQCLIRADDALCAEPMICVPIMGCVDPPADAGFDAGVDAMIPDADGMDADAVDAGTDTGGVDAAVPDTGTDAPPDTTPPMDAGCTNGARRACPGGVGVCGGGSETCVGGSWNGVCEMAVLPAPYEECLDGVDSDCDGDASSGEACCFTETYGGHTYAFCHRNRGGHGSSTILCRNYGFELAEVNDAAENAFIAGQAADGANYWIGLNDITSEGVWQWARGGSLYRNWASTEPDSPTSAEDCVVMNGLTGEWSDVLCTPSNAFVCESL